MRYCLAFGLLFFFSCKKQNAIIEMEGSYKVEGYQIRCNYFGCDSTMINSILKMKFDDDNIRVRATIYDEIIQNDVGLGVLDISEITKDKVVMILSEKHLKYLRNEKIIEYYDANNWNKPNLTDTASNYYYLKGVKQ